MINDDIQKQSSGDNSNNYQSKGAMVINQGLSIEQVKELIQTENKNTLLQLFMDNFINLQNIAKELVNERAEEITNDFNKKLLEQDEIITRKIYDRLSEPDMQMAFFDAQKGYARTGDKNKAQLLTDLLIEKGQKESGKTEDYLINQAIEIIPNLTLLQIKFLGFTALKYVNWHISNDTVLCNALNKVYLPFCECVTLSDNQINYLIQMNCLKDNSIIESGIGHSTDTIIRKLRESINQYDGSNLDDSQIEEKILKLVPEMKILLDYDKNKRKHNAITPLGRMIGYRKISAITVNNINWDYD